MRTQIESPSGNGPRYFRIPGQNIRLNSPLYPSEANKPGYGQLYIFDSTEATTMRLETQLNQERMAEEMQRLEEMRHVNSFAELCKRMKCMNE